jgi:hypothetical protein
MNDQQHIDISRAEAAKRIMDDPMVKEALQAIEDGIFAAWKDMPLRDTEGSEHLRRLLQAKKKFEAVFHAHMQNGALAAAELRADEVKKGLLSRVKEHVYGR